MTPTRFPLPVIADGKSVPLSAPASSPRLRTTKPSSPRRRRRESTATDAPIGAPWRSRRSARKAIRNRDREFAPGQLDVPTGFQRRDFLQLMGASLALAGLTACTEKPVERVLAYTKTPDGLAPGNPLHYATAYARDGIGTGLLVTSWEGRPTKVEGNPSHPGSRGTTGPAEQALLLQLYDPSRARVLKERGAGRAWHSFREAMAQRASVWGPTGGANLHFLVEPSSSPTVLALRQEILAPLSQGAHPRLRQRPARQHLRGRPVGLRRRARAAPGPRASRRRPLPRRGLPRGPKRKPRRHPGVRRAGATSSPLRG